METALDRTSTSTSKTYSSEAFRVSGRDWVPEGQPIGLDPEAVFAAGLRHHHIANTAYPIAHRKTIWHFRQPSERHPRLIREALRGSGLMSLYAHIPFCERRCTFCEYCVIENHTAAAEAAYHRALLRELDLYLKLIGRKRLAGFDIGGGTPALIHPRRVARLVERVALGFDLAPGFSVSIETTPRSRRSTPNGSGPTAPWASIASAWACRWPTPGCFGSTGAT